MTVVDVTGGEVGGCCQVTVIASLSSCATATTLEGHKGTPTSDHERNGKSLTLYIIYVVYKCV